MINEKILRNESSKLFDSLNKRNSKLDLNKIIELESFIRKRKHEIQELTAQKNIISKEISILIKNDKNDEITKLKNQVNTINSSLEKKKKDLFEKDLNLKNLLMFIPNIPDESVPYGACEKDNVEIRKINKISKFDFVPKAHWELGKNLDIIQLERATLITGSRFSIYKNKGAKLMRALQALTLDILAENNFIEYLLPVIVNEKSLINTGQLPVMKEDVFKVDFKNYFLSPTLEVQLTNLFANKILDESKLPFKVTSSSLNFRAEAGAAGKDVKGLIRQHQFLKTEMVIISDPKNSWILLEEMVLCAEEILKILELPYRTILLCTGDMGFASAKTYDIEVYLPSYNNYREISSCSNCTDFQARRAKIRFKSNDGTNELVHTLNGSGLALDRLWVAVVENYQQKDGSIKIPKILQKYLNFELIE